MRKKLAGRPSNDIKHPDYVPTVFSHRNATQKKKKFTKKILCEFEELPILSAKAEDNSINESEGSDGEEFASDAEWDVFNNSQAKHLAFQPEVRNSSLINAGTIKRILEEDASQIPSNSSAESSSTGQHFNPRLFTFIDPSGRTIARFVEKRVRKNARHLTQESSSYPVETVQVIIDKKKAKTVAVDRRAICISSTPELCCKNKAKKTCIVDISSIEVKSDSSSTEETMIKCEPKSDTEVEHREEDYINYFTELEDFKQLENSLEIKTEDVES